MAFVDPDATTAQVPATQAAQNAPVSSGGAGAAGTATKPAANTPGVNVPQQPSAALSAYLNANQPQATALAGQIAGSVGNQVNTAQQAVLPAVNTYTGQLTNVPTNAAVNQEVQTAPSQMSAADQATYEQELAAANNAPNSAGTFETTAPYQSLTSQIQSAVEQANLWNVGNDPATIASQMAPFETNNASTGDTTLDAILLSQTPAAAQTLQAAAAPAANLQSYLNTEAGAADTALQNSIASDQATTQAATQASDQYVSNLTTTLNNAVATAQAAALQGNDSILQDLQNNTLTPADQATLGITNDQLAGLETQLQLAETPQAVISQGAGQYEGNAPTQNINLLAYLNQQDPNAAITAANTATPQEYSDLAALENMMGSEAPQNVPLQAANASQAGTAPTVLGINSFNTTGALNAAINAAATDKSVEQAYLNALQSGSDQSHAEAAAQNVASNEELAGDITAPLVTGILPGLLIDALVPGAAQWIGRNEDAIANGFEDFGNDIARIFSRL